MAVKYTIQGIFIYATMCLYLLALLLRLLGLRRAGHVVYAGGFIVSVLSFAYRWYHVGHAPMQNLFEVFLFMGMIYPVSLVCRYWLRVGGETIDMLIGAVVLFPAGFIFAAEPTRLPPALQCWLFVPHVAVYMLAYIFMAKAAAQAFAERFAQHDRPDQTTVDYEEATYRTTCVGFPLLTLGLVLGSWWARLAWGDFWGWDPKELWSLASWLIYVGYFHFRYMYRRRYPWANSLWSIAGLAAIVVTLLWVNLARVFSGLHSYAS